MFARALSKESAVDTPQQGAVSYHGDDQHLPAAWLPPVTSDAAGRFQVVGVPAGRGVFLFTGVTERFAPQSIALNTGTPQQRGQRDATYRPLVKDVAPGDEVVLPLSPAQWFEGQVTYEDTGQPAPHARLTIWASQQEKFGSMYSLAGQADDRGALSHLSHAGRSFRRQRLSARWHALSRPANAPFRGNSVAGRRPGETGRHEVAARRAGARNRCRSGLRHPVAGAAIQYVPEASNNPHVKDNVMTGWQGIQLSDSHGKFEIAILPGPGRLLVNGPHGQYVLQQISAEELDRGKPGGRRNYAHAIERIEPAVGADPIDLTVSLQPGATITGQMVDEQGAKIENALVISRLRMPSLSLDWRGMTPPTLGGNFELSGLAPDQEYPVHFLDPKQRLGATQIFRADSKPATVVLKPCGQASARFVDGEGKPVVDYDPIFHIVVTPGVNQQRFRGRPTGQTGGRCRWRRQRRPHELLARSQNRCRWPHHAAGFDSRRDLSNLSNEE